MWRKYPGEIEMVKQKNNEDFDPKLREAMAKIEAIATEYDCAYLCVLSSRTHTEYKSDFPKWSLLQYDKDKSGIRIRTKRTDPELTDSSLHLLYSIRDVAGMTFVKLQEIAEQIEKLVKVEHKPFGGK